MGAVRSARGRDKKGGEGGGILFCEKKAIDGVQKSVKG